MRSVIRIVFLFILSVHAELHVQVLLAAQDERGMLLSKPDRSRAGEWGTGTP